MLCDTVGSVMNILKVGCDIVKVYLNVNCPLDTYSVSVFIK